VRVFGRRVIAFGVDAAHAKILLQGQISVYGSPSTRRNKMFAFRGGSSAFSALRLGFLLSSRHTRGRFSSASGSPSSVSLRSGGRSWEGKIFAPLGSSSFKREGWPVRGLPFTKRSPPPTEADRALSSAAGGSCPLSPLLCPRQKGVRPPFWPGKKSAPPANRARLVLPSKKGRSEPLTPTEGEGRLPRKTNRV